MLPGNTLHEVFAARVREAPDRIAVTCADDQLTYAELDRRAGNVARRLRARGVGPDTLVGLCCERGTSLIAGLVGILKAGGAYVPIDPAYPDERIALLLRDSGVKLVVATGSAAERVRGADAELVDADSVDGADARDRGSASGSAEIAPSHLAYVIYTSGSTGTPKGVEVEHRNVVRLFTGTDPWFRFGPDDVWTMFHSASFDFSVWEIWGALLYGGRLVIAPPAATRAPAAFLDLLRRERVTVLNQTPSAFRQLIAVDDGADLSLRYVIFGGERLDVSMLTPWIVRHGDDRPRLVNMYGITETTVHVTYRPIRTADLNRPEVSAIGVPIPDLTVSLHDESGRLVPPGTPGEMWVSGAGVARGYHNRPELTAERFVTGPDGRRAYRSGDRALRGPGADLVYLGRIDDQIKVRGFRIEPHEVETCLSAHPSVAGAVVTTRDYGGGDVRLVAYVQPAPGTVAVAGTLGDELRAHAAEHLPAHLRPSDYLPIKEIPMTAQGKADRAALRDHDPERAADDQGRSENQRIVERIVTEVLQRESIAPDADMFDLGATSLAFIRIIAQVNERFGVSLTGSELGDTASVSRLAAAVDAARTTSAARAA